MTPAVLQADTVKAPGDLIALFVAHGDVKPSMISVKANNLVLRTTAGDSASLAYTIVDVADKRYTLGTTQGEGVFQIRDSEAATLNIAGATYELKR